MVTFVDTPGLIDEESSSATYPYDVDRALLWLGAMADLIFIFFDPIGQALRKHTLDVVEALFQQAGSDTRKFKLYLSKVR